MTRPKSLARSRLGPVPLRAGTVVLRPPRLADYPLWRHIRLRDRRHIEPFWYSSALDWDARHSAAHWVRECLMIRAEARAGRRLATVIEVDGRFAGQIELGTIDPATGTAEMGIWVDATVARHGIGGLAAAMLLDHGFTRLGLRRVTAPISPANLAAAHGAAGVGFRREALMGRYFDVGGARRDHELWAVTVADRPPDGFAGHWLARHDRPDAAALPEPVDPVPLAVPKLAMVLAGARFYAGRAVHLFDPLGTPPPIRLADPDHPEVVIRTRRPTDWRGWRAARARGRTVLDPDAASAEPAWAAQHTWSRWLREYLRTRAGLRAPGGLVLAVEVDGVYAGEARLFDRDMFDRNARMFVWVDPAHPAHVRVAATRALLTLAFGPLGLCRVATTIAPGDRAAAEIAARVGMAHEGRLRCSVDATGRRADHDLWAITTPTPPERAPESPTPTEPSPRGSGKP
ncbi:GNAT family N-acetyltransferase [Nocardia brasiliensis]|uniref:GNAT family N-acetyltransferase n=1 Tax=Nocardia brasiliensis TaxID=37326 RepID=A0A6G9XRN9_NOCBR|nr:GNAT family protein [Nocardia brasiliensis]QIS03621.1 GNAT family N-acetyltransferase [Nocardia brasiliensis]